MELPNMTTASTGLLATLAADAKAAETFLEAEGAKVLTMVKAAEKPIVDVFEALVGDAKAKASTLVTAAESAVSEDLSSLEADFETAIANFFQANLGGAGLPATSTGAGANLIAETVTSAESLIKPLFVKVLSALGTAA